ncbi:hypothetical protein F5X68DRAFT_242805 [Plectosphaerella plurivora]|uniref:Uncharacterized protein n=1 Tax=Plectosphaerella plurivora TaxID=936078 RepID=A0A9P8V910_9PEZI|nr:hypothetical protein F5X68DRAFT_242805 [Plectosphaerella plurivora]
MRRSPADRRHDRLVKLRDAIWEKDTYRKERAAKLEDITHAAYMTELPSSRLPPGQEDDEKRYGCTIPRDELGRGSVLQYIVRVDAKPEHRNSLPPIGQTVQLVITGVEYSPRPPPDIGETPEERAERLAMDLHKVLRDQADRIWALTGEMEHRIKEVNNGGKVDPKLGNVQAMREFLEAGVKEYRGPMIASLVRLITIVPDTFVDKTSYAEHLLETRALRDDLEDREWIDVLTELCLEIDAKERQEVLEAEAGPVIWHAVRINTPNVVDNSSDAFFLASLPHERRWVEGHLEPSYSALGRERVWFTGFIAPPMRVKVPDVGPSLVKNPDKKVEVLVRWEPSNNTTREESDAMSRMAHADDPLQRAQWSYAESFLTDKTVDFTQALPGLDISSFDPSVRPSMVGVTEAPAGIWLVEGSQGPDRTVLATTIAAQACTGKFVVPKIIEPEKITSANTAKKDVHDDDADSESDPSGERWILSPDIEITPPPVMIHGDPPVFWYGRVVHVYSWRAELFALEDDPKTTKTSDSPISQTEESIITAAHVRQGPLDDPYSLSSLTRAAIDARSKRDPGNIASQWRDILRWKTEAHHSFESSAGEFRQMSKELMLDTLEKAKIIVGTTVSLGQLGQRWEQSRSRLIIIIDEVDRIPEPSFWIAPSRFAGPIIAFGASSKNLHEGKGKHSMRGPQPKLSILHRAAYWGARISRLNTEGGNDQARDEDSRSFLERKPHYWHFYLSTTCFKLLSST